MARLTVRTLTTSLTWTVQVAHVAMLALDQAEALPVPKDADAA